MNNSNRNSRIIYTSEYYQDHLSYYRGLFLRYRDDKKITIINRIYHNFAYIKEEMELLRRDLLKNDFDIPDLIRSCKKKYDLPQDLGYVNTYLIYVAHLFFDIQENEI